MEQLNPARPSPVPSVPPLDLAPVVLIADNEPTLLELFQELLGDDRLRVLTAANGQRRSRWRRRGSPMSW